MVPVPEKLWEFSEGVSSFKFIRIVIEQGSKAGGLTSLNSKVNCYNKNCKFFNYVTRVFRA